MPVWAWMLAIFAVFAGMLAWRIGAGRSRGAGEDTGWGVWDLVSAAGAALSLAGVLLSIAYAEQIAAVLEQIWPR